MAFEVTLVPKENIELGVTQKAVFTLSNVTPTIPVPGPVGPQGPPGPQGPQGLPGTGVNSTDDVPEGDINLYYTEERVEAVIAVTPPAPHTHVYGDIVDFNTGVFESLVQGDGIKLSTDVNGDTIIDADIPNATTSVDGLMSATDKTKLNGIASGAEVNVNADWNATSGDAQILNKPTIVSSVGATAPITSSGGTNPTISTSMATNRLIGRTTAGSGVMEEISVGTGLQLSAGTLSATTIPGAGITKATASGTDTYTATISGVTTYTDGDTYLLRFINGNTTGATLNINALGARTLYRNNDGALIGGDITSGGEMLCIYNSTLNGFQCIGTAPNSLFAYVTNVETSTITKGQPVYAFGGTGDRLTVKLAYNTGDSTSAQTIGLVWSSSIGANQKGLILIQGQLDSLNIFPTATWSDGDAVYLGATAGTLTKTKPSAPNHLVYLGYVTTASNGAAGRMYVRVQNGYELQELHNVALSSPPNNNDGLFYETATSLWKNKSIPTVLGYTPENVANKSDSYTVSSSTTYATTKAVVDGLATKLSTSLKGANNGLAELDGSGKVPTAQLPSYVDDVLEYPNIGALPATGSAGIIYVTLDDNKIYRWSGTAYTVISDTIALGETSATAYRGDRGKIAYDHSQIITGNPHGTTKSDVGLNNVDNTSDANKPVSTATQTALNLKVDANTAITGATKTKITFDSKGLVTAGADATTADIAESTNKLYVSDGDKGDITVSGNGTVWTIDNQAVTFAKIQNVTTGTLFGRTDAGSGVAGSITIGTGLTGSASTLTANLSVGVDSGQSVIGGLRASENLTLSSTSNATKGKILFGTSAYDEVNNRLGIGTTTPTLPLHVVGQGQILPTLTNTTAAAISGLSVTNTLSPTSDSQTQFRSLNMSNTFSASGINFTGSNPISSGFFENRIINANNITADLVGVNSNGILLGSTAVALGTVSNVYGLFVRAFNSFSNSIAATITNAYGYQYREDAKNTLIVTNQTGLNVPNLVAATNNTNILLGTTTIPSGNWSIYNASTYNNYILGNTYIGSTTDSGFKLDVTGTARVSTSLDTPIIRGETTSGGTLTLSSTSNATKGKILFGTSAYDEANQRLGIGTQSPTSAIHFVLPTNLSGTQNAMYLSSAFDATSAGVRSFIQYDLTTAGGDGNIFGLTLNLLPGQTGTSSTQAIRIINTTTTSPTFNPFTGTGNAGATVSSSGAGGGANYGMSTTASNALFNIGNRARAVGGTTANSTNVGVLGIGNVGTSTGTVYQIGGYFTLETVTPSLTFSAALACDNGTATNDIFVARDNGTVVWKIVDGGNTEWGDTRNMVFNTSTGTKIGTATNQKLAFWNATPIVQPTTAVGAANLVSNAGTTLTSTDTFDGYTLQQVVKALRNTGLLA